MSKAMKGIMLILLVITISATRKRKKYYILPRGKA